MAISGTAKELLPYIASGSQVSVRDEEWLVRSVEDTPSDGRMVRCTGTSSLVRDTEATFFTAIDRIQPMRPEDTRLVHDASPNYRRSRLFLEAVLRKTSVPSSDTDLAVAGRQLLEPLQYQRRAVHKALDNLQPRVLIADAVGLGKTLEVGLLLSELIRRGRGDRILVVTPRHILEQFQHELWTRFAIPLVRLDSEGIQRVRRKIPANRNPFAYYKRAIISIDTLKNAGRYRHHLEGIHWDAVVIDECHNLVNRGTLNNQLARVLAPRTEALILTSATPHNGDPKSFAELVRLLDPTAIADPTNITQADIEHLYIRRHKGNDEVASEVGNDWADRLPPQPLAVTPSAKEMVLFDELADTWVHPVEGTAPVSGTGAALFPWTLFKAALSSHKALAETVRNRRRTLRRSGKSGEFGGVASERQAEDDALARLGELAEAVTDADASKLNALIAQLQEVGVGPKSKVRAVVFSERIATLDWLAETLPGRLGLDPASQVRVLHGGMADVKQMEVIEEFGLGDSPVRLLLTGDMASEGVNLHRECHNLIHFDLPWSLITIEQRNGRIDRYGQRERPDIRALIVTPDHERLTGDVHILSKLLIREDEAHRAFGESGSLFGLHTADAETDEIMRALNRGDDVDTIIPAVPTIEFDLLAILGGGTGMSTVPERRPPSLFATDHDFVREALIAAFPDPQTLDLHTEAEDPLYLSIVPPADLVKRLSALPQSYLSEQKVTERLKVTADPVIATYRLDHARQSEDSQWPDVAYLSPLHPIVDWLADKVLVGFGRNEAPVLVANVDSPTVCIQGVWSNGRGRPQLVDWLAVGLSAGGDHRIEDLFEALDRAGVGPTMANPGATNDLTLVQTSLRVALDVATEELKRRRAEHDLRIDELLSGPTERLAAWIAQSEQLASGIEIEHRRAAKRAEIEAVRASTERLIASLRTTGAPLIRVVAVLLPAGAAL